MADIPCPISPIIFNALLSRFRLEKGSAATALTNCLMVNEQDLGSVPYVRVNKQYFLGTKFVGFLR